MNKARLYWHVFVTHKTPAIVAEQLRYVGRQPYPVTAVVTWEAPYEHCVPLVAALLKEHHSVDRIKTGLAEAFEFDTLKILYQEAKDYEFVGYFHTKGAVMESSNTGMWRNLMNFYTVQMGETSVLHLEKDGSDLAGAFGAEGLSGQKPYIAGNFWWARSTYIQQLPFPALLTHHTRYDCELWVGLGSGKRLLFLDTSLFASPLTELAEQYNTDKKAHGYMSFYELYLAAFRNRVGRLLEIGVYEGESLRLWQATLPHFMVEGVDIEAKPEDSVLVHVGDQADRTFLSTLPDYDVVIDDGGHRSRQQIISLVSMVQTTQLYVIEDLHTSQPDLYPAYHEAGEITCLEYLQQYPNLKPDYISDAEHGRLAGRRIFLEEGVFSPIAFIV